MDGVLSDFSQRYSKLYGYIAGGEGTENDRDKKEFSKNWNDFVETKQFEILDWFTGGKELIDFVKSLNVRIEILSSSGGAKFHSEIREQKEIWLAKNNITFPVNIVPGRRTKRFFSYKGNVLIDDTKDVVDEFNQYGGKAILHTDANKTIEELKAMMQ